MLHRRKAREAALRSIYAVDVGANSPREVTQDVIKKMLVDDSAGIKFSEKVLLITTEHKKEFDEIIGKHINNWDVDRLAILDKLILRMAITEFLHFEDIPTKVTINEAIELAKSYSTRKSGTFVNGILDAVLQDLNRENRIVKKGRGLIETSKK